MAVFRPLVGAWFVLGAEPTYLGLEGDVPVGGTTTATRSAPSSVPRWGPGSSRAQTASTWAWRATSPWRATTTAMAAPTERCGDRPRAPGTSTAAPPSTWAWRATSPCRYPPLSTKGFSDALPGLSTAGESASLFGTDGDIPTVGDYDGGAKADIGVYRPSTGIWYLRQSGAGDTAVVFGTDGDVALSLPAAVHQRFFPTTP